MRSRDLQDQKSRALRGTVTPHWPSQLPADILRDRHTQPVLDGKAWLLRGSPCPTTAVPRNSLFRAGLHTFCSTGVVSNLTAKLQGH